MTSARTTLTLAQVAARREAIAQADAYLSNAGLPTFSAIADLAIDSARLGLQFDIGRATIHRSYIDQQTLLMEKVSTLRKSLPGEPWNVPGHVCQKTNRRALTLADGFERKDAAERDFFAYDADRAALGLNPWSQIEAIEPFAYEADGKPTRFIIDFANGKSDEVPATAVIYMERTVLDAMLAAKAAT